MLTGTFCDLHVEQLFDVVKRVVTAISKAGVPYRLVGGFAVYSYVNERDPTAARLTRDVDIAVGRADMERIREAVRPLGFEHRHAAGVDMLVDARPTAPRSSVHLVFIGEKVRAEYPEAVPDCSPPVPTSEGFLLAPVAHLVRMKLTSYRLKDRVHIKDMDGVGLITPEIESALSPVLLKRLQAVRREE